MYEKRYEYYLAQSFIEWVNKKIEPGHRYLFKSPDIDKSTNLYNAFVKLAEGNAFQVNGVNFPFINCNGVRLIPVLQGEQKGNFTENFISHLRDEISEREGAFNNTSLLIIHNSMLDTLINSALDITVANAIWNPSVFAKKIKELIDPKSEKKEITKCLVDDQLAMIIEEGGTIFGFSPLFNGLEDGELDFNELGLFVDPLLLEYKNQPAQIHRRINKNRELRQEIEFAVEHYPDQLELKLKNFSARFIKEHFIDKKDWNKLTFNEYLKEIDNNKSQRLVLEKIEIKDVEFFERAKSQTKTGQKDIGLIIQVPQCHEKVKLVFTFAGNDLVEDEFRISHNKYLSKNNEIKVYRKGGKHCCAEITLPFNSYDPVFYSLELKRDNRSEEYKFRCLMVREKQFYFGNIKNHYRVDTGKERLTILLEDNKLRISETLNEEDNYYILEQNDDIIDVDKYNIVDFEQYINQTEFVQFNISNQGVQLKLNIEGPVTEDNLHIPLLFDKGRFKKLFDDSYYAEYHRLRGKIIIDNTESNITGIRHQLLKFESIMIDELLLCVDPNSQLALSEIKICYPKLYDAYYKLFNYLKNNNTTPSIVSWGPDYRHLVQAVIDCYEKALNDIQLDCILSKEHKKLLRIGLHKQDNLERISPFHPLVLSYYLMLVMQIIEDKDEEGNSSFTELPKITIERLVVSGLIPFLFDANFEFSHVLPIKDNPTWLDIIPQRQVSYSYVKRLVKDKINDFAHSYSRLFSVGKNSTLIINAINQNKAEELFLGIIDYFKQHKESALTIHVNFYDNQLTYNEFDYFSETISDDELRNKLDLNTGDWRTEANLFIDVVRNRLTYSKFVTPQSDQPLAYAHLAFFSNDIPVDCRDIKIENALSGVLCDGLISGEASENKEESYFTAFGLRGVDIEKNQSLRLARLFNTLWKPARQSNTSYSGHGIGLAVRNNFQKLLQQSYDSALWTTIIDPKVTLDFFTKQKDVVLIHYSDQYTNSAGYDAITVTKQIDLFNLLLDEENPKNSTHLLSEFNAFNGEWLLKMLTACTNERKEKKGIIGAYKFINTLLSQSDICWVPISVAEMIRVSGNVGLKMNMSDFSRRIQGYKKGAISDDVLFVGFKHPYMYLLPLEVKTGARPDFNHAGEQAKELKRYLVDDILGPNNLASRLYRGLFIRQVLMQVEKFRLYDVLSKEKLIELLSMRDWWLSGSYQLSDIPNYVDGFIVAHIESGSCFDVSCKVTDKNILQIELPYSLLSSLINTNDKNELAQLVQNCRIDDEFILKPFTLEATNTKPILIENTKTEDIEESAPMIATIDEKSPVSTITLDHLKILFGHSVIHNEPLYWQPTNTARFMNTNTGIIGTMGTGKTQFTKSVVTQLIQNQKKNVNGEPIGVLIFDYKSDYVDDAFVNAIEAKKFNLFKLPYNPLSLYGDTPMLPLHTATGFSETMSSAYGLGQKQQLKLENLILECYKEFGIYPEDPSTWGRIAPTIEDIWQKFLQQEKVEEDSLYAALSKLARFKIFEDIPEKMTSLYDLMSGVVVIELAGYPSEIQNLIVALTLDLFYSQMQKKGKPHVKGDYRQITKMILVDEADNFMSQDFPSLRKILKEGREYGVGVILSTQDLSHFKTGENKYASYVLTWIIHRVSEIKNADIKAIFNKDDKSEQEQLMETIRKLDKHYSLYIDGDKKVQKIRDLAFWELINK